MTRLARIVLVTSTLMLLGGCASIGDAIDPAEWFASAGDMFSSKKKLPGDRKPVFPEGVPGVAQGIPQELVKGNQPPQESGFASTDPQNVGSTPQQKQQPKQKTEAKPEAKTEEFQPAPREKAKPKPKPKPATAEQPPPVQERQSATARRAPEPQPQQQPQQQSGGNAVQWPDPPPQRSSSQSGGIQWPDPPPMR